MLAPRFLDTVEPSEQILRQAAGGGFNPVVALGSNGSQSAGIFNPTAKNGDLVRHFTYWNFVAVSRICDRVSTVFPNIGYKANAGTSKGLQSLGPQQRQHISRHYGRLIQSHEEFKPLEQSHPLFQLLSDVNPQDTWMDLVYDTFMFLQLTGEAYWWLIPSQLGKLTGRNIPAQIWLIPTQFIQGWNYSDDGMLKSYTMIPHGNKSSRQEIPAEEIKFFSYKNPHQRGRGFSPIQAAPFWSLNGEEIEKSRYHSFKNRINPEHLVVMEPDSQLMQNGINIVDMIQERLMQREAGFMNSRKPLVMPPGVKDIKELGLAPKEMDFGTSSDQVRDQVLALHGVPKVIAGITDDVNRATVEGANVIFCENTINPKLAKFGCFLTEHLASIYDPRIVVWFDTCTPASAEQELRENQFDFQVGALTPDERRIERGRQPVGEPNYETGYVGSSVVPLSEEVKDANMERALDIAGARAKDDPAADDSESDPPQPKGKKSEDDPADGEDPPEKKPAKPKQGADTFPGLDNL